MNNNKQKKHRVLITLLFLWLGLCVQATDKNESKILDDFIKAQGYHDVIIFDASNIKQYWIDYSVISQNNLINIQLKDNKTFFESIPLKIQLANVKISQQCKIDVISDDPSLSFTVSSENTKEISNSKPDTPFINYHIASSTFRIISLKNNSFSLNIRSKNNSRVSISKIVLSFSKIDKLNSELDFSSLSRNDFSLGSASFCEGDEIAIQGKRSRLFLKDKISTEDKEEILTSVTIKNTGDQTTKIFYGYSIFNKDGVALSGGNYPPNSSECQILTIVSAEQGTSTIVVETYPPSWSKNASIALDPKEDLSDIPNTNLLSSKIINVTKEPNGQATITLDSPLKSSLEKGSKIRVHGVSGSYLYSAIKDLKPGEEAVFTSLIKKDDSAVHYSSNIFPQGAFYFSPIILSYSAEANVNNTFLVSDYSIYSISK